MLTTLGGLNRARQLRPIDLVPMQTEGVPLLDQSGIKSCPGRFIDWSHPVRRRTMPSLNSNPMSFGVQPDEIMPKAIYLASKRIGVVFQVGSAVSSLTPPWLPPQTLVARWYHGSPGVQLRTDANGTDFAVIPLSRFVNGQP